MESSQNVQNSQEKTIPVSERGTLSVVPEEMTTGAEHANSGDNANPEEPQETPLIAPGDHVHVPGAIAAMIHNGIDFIRTRDAWNITEDNVVLKKPFSVYFTLDTPCVSHDVITGLIDAGVDHDEIISVQHRLSSNMWVVSLGSAEAKNIALSAWHINTAGKRVFLADCDNRVSLVKIYNAPNEMPDSVIIGRLASYGTVLSFRRNLASDCIYNGVRTARMRIMRNIPSTVRIAREFIRIWYPGQPKACRRCGDLGHLIKDCTSVRCFNCEASGHRASECERPILCSICLSDDHRERHCPYLLFSANVDIELFGASEAVPPSSYASVARTPRAAAPQIVLDPDPPPAPNVRKDKSEEKTKDTGTAKAKEREKAKEKDKDKDKERKKEKDKGHSRDVEMEESTERRRSSRERSHGSHEYKRESRERDYRDDEGERDRERDRDRDRERDRERERARDRSRHHHRYEHSRDEDRRRDRDQDRDRDYDPSEDELTDSDEEWITVRGKHSKYKH